jgi:co-chaperonin GroES (HSP10)
MSTAEIEVREELMREIPINSASNQSDVPTGYYRTIAGNLRKLKTYKKMGRPYAKAPDPNNFAPLGGNTRLIPRKEQIVVRVDRFKDEATCRACQGEGHSEATCPDCGGVKVHYVDANGQRDKRVSSDKSLLRQVACPTCKATTYSSPLPRSTGRVPCTPCKGTGQNVGGSGLAISTEHEGEPTTGIILAIGDTVTEFLRGQRVLFSRFAGQEYDFDGRKYRIMSQNYPIGVIVGDADVRMREVGQ